MSISRRTLSALILALLATASLSAASVQGSFQRTFQVSGPVDLEVLTRSGNISVHSGPAGTVSVNGKIHVSDRWFEGTRQSDVSELEKNPPVRQSGNSIHIDYVNMRNISIDYDITVPADTAVRARSGSGNKEIEGLRSKLDLESGSGDMRLRDVSGDIHVHTGSGNVEGREVSGPLTAAFFAQRRIWASRAKRRVSCDAIIARLARFLTKLHHYRCSSRNKPHHHLCRASASASHPRRSLSGGMLDR